jgi:3-hydroxyisobutyrate dehydrogenase
MTTQKIAYLGLGAMGRRMAQRLLDAGHEVTVFNRTARRAEDLVAAGARRAESPRQAVSEADVVITCLRDDEAVREVWLDPEAGAKGGMCTGSLVIESSTLTPDFVRELSEALGGLAFVEAPVVGSRPQAEAGQLVHLVGGDDEAVARARPVLAQLGRAAHHLGPVGTAATVKLVINSLFAIQVAALGEAVGVVTKAGIGLPGLLTILADLPITSPAMAGLGQAMAARKFDPLFPVELVAKDLAYAVANAEALGADVPTTATVASLYAAAADSDLGEENIHAIAKRFA